MFLYGGQGGRILGSIADPRVLTLFGEHEVMQPQLIPMEINLEGFPLFSRQKTPEGKALEVHQSVSTNDGRRLNQLWRVTASHDFSLPGTFDEDVFVGVMALVRRRGGCRKTARSAFRSTSSSRCSARASAEASTRRFVIRSTGSGRRFTIARTPSTWPKMRAWRLIASRYGPCTSREPRAPRVGRQSTTH